MTGISFGEREKNEKKKNAIVDLKITELAFLYSIIFFSFCSMLLVIFQIIVTVARKLSRRK